jgi:hypothetical protein
VYGSSSIEQGVNDVLNKILNVRVGEQLQHTLKGLKDSTCSWDSPAGSSTGTPSGSLKLPEAMLTLQRLLLELNVRANVKAVVGEEE